MNPQFLNSDINCYCSSLENNIQSEQLKVIPNVKSRNQYLSNKTLGEEYCYVLNRKKESRYVGNTLEKPPILLKRNYVRDTFLDKEEVATGSTFKENITYDKESKIQADLEKIQQMMIDQNIKKSSTTLSTGVDGFLNFLRYPSLILANVTPNAEGKIILDGLNLSIYSTVEIVVTNLDVVVHEIIPLILAFAVFNKSELLFG